MTVVPYCTKLLKMDLLSKVYIDYINAYHERCMKEVGAILKSKGWELGYQWLFEQTKPIKGV